MLLAKARLQRVARAYYQHCYPDCYALTVKSKRANDASEDAINFLHAPTRLTTRTATQMATPSVHACSARCAGTAAPKMVDTWSQQLLCQTISNITKVSKHTMSAVFCMEGGCLLHNMYPRTVRMSMHLCYGTFG